MGDKLCEYLKAIGKDALDVLKEHIQLKEQHNMGVITTHDKEERIKDNLKKAFTMVNQENAFYEFMYLRRMDNQMQILREDVEEQQDEDSEDDREIEQS